jgi:branched-chain amino acid transport system permease protein
VLSLYLNAAVTGFAIGAIYGLIAIAYSVVYVGTGVFNLAQGDLLMVAVMLSYYFLEVEHLPQIVDFGLVIILVTALSLIEERIVVRPFITRAKSGLGWFISTLGFALVLETVAELLYGNNPPLPIASPLGLGSLHIGYVSLTWALGLIIVVLVVVAALIHFIYRRTWIGQALRASAEDRQIASLRGISPTRSSQLAFAMGGLISAVGGYVVAPVVFASVSIGLTYSIFGFVALAIGGFGSVRGAAIGALLVGTLQGLFDVIYGSGNDIIVPLALLMLVLIVRPQGLFGSRNLRSV